MTTTNATFGARAVSGVLWGVVGGTVGKLAGFVAQIYLGWALSKQDFALFAMATSVAAVLAGLVNGGTQRILIQRGGEYEFLSPTVFSVSLLFNSAVFIALACLAVPIANWYAEPALISMLILMGVATVLSTPGFILNARLSGELEFKKVQVLAMASHLVRYSSTILFAALGFGPLSFVLPVVVIAFSDTFFAWRVVGKWPRLTRPVPEIAREVLSSSKWVMAGTFANSIIQNGGNLAVGIVADPAVLAVYFFGFQLTFATASLMGGTLQAVVMPTLAGMAGQKERQADAFRRMAGVTILTASAASLLGTLVAGVVISGIWKTKWLEAVPVVQALMLGVPATITCWVGRGAIESQGRWASAMTLSVAEGVLTVAVAAATAKAGLLVLSASIAGLKIVMGFCHLLVVGAALGLPGMKSTGTFLISQIALCGSAAAGFFFITATSARVGTLVATSIAVVGAGVLFASIAKALCPGVLKDSVNVFNHVRGRFGPSKA